MTDETKNLKLFKYNTRTDRKEKFSVDDALNDNWDKVDEAVNANKESIAEVKEEVAGIISPPPIELESGKFLSNDGNKLVWKEVEAGASGEELALKEDKANKGVPGGYAGLNARGKVFGSQLDLSSKQDVLVPGEGIKIVGNTISSTVTGGASGEELALKEDKANKGVANGYAGLDDTGKVPTAQLPNTGLELCDIGMALYVDETKGLRRRLNGSIMDITSNYQAFLTRLKEITTLYPSLVCTESEWQTTKTMSKLGQCGKFVFNYGADGTTITSIRLPLVININGLVDMANAGLIKDESLPNITGKFNSAYNSDNLSGAFGWQGNMPAQGTTNSSSTGGMNFDASRSSSAYQDNAHVQQEAIQYPYFIQIATGSETENNIINEIELNNPYSLFDSKYSDHELNNLSWLKSEGQWNAKAVYPTAYDKLLKVYNGTETVEGLSVKLSTETYTDYDFVLNTADETFRLPLKTKLASGNAVVGNGMTVGLTNGTTNFGLRIFSDNAAGHLGGSTEGYGTDINSTTTTNTYPTGNRTIGLTTDPTKSGIELSDSNLYLYFYVGETVQNANLIDAGRIGEQLANKQDKLIRYPIAVSDKSLMPSWYVVYNDGWCEQGGRYTINTNGSGTITFLKEFVDTSYTIFNSKESTDSSTWTVMFDTFETRTTSQIVIKANLTGYTLGGSWEAKGYIK